MENLLEIKNLIVEYSNINKKNLQKTIAVNNVSFTIREGEIYALAGESGCGKTTLSRCITYLVPHTSGDILFSGKSIFSLSKDEKKKYPTLVQMVFQNPYSSLNPKMKIFDILKEPLDINTHLSKIEKQNKVLSVLKDVGLTEDVLNLYPHEFSGGQRQRIAIARALILEPKLLIADEPVSALDASIQAQIINLFKDLRLKKNLTILFISHDMNVIKFLADRIGIMHNGKIVEESSTTQIFNNPKEEYTKLLLSSVPTLKI